MKKINLSETDVNSFIKMPTELLKEIEGGCTFYKDYTCSGTFLHNRRDYCGYMHLNLSGKYKKRYHKKNATCIGYSW